MAKVYKATIYLTDVNGDIGDLDNLETLIENRLGRYSSVHFAETKESKEFEWHDDININKISATNEDYEEYFKEENLMENLIVEMMHREARSAKKEKVIMTTSFFEKLEPYTTGYFGNIAGIPYEINDEQKEDYIFVDYYEEVDE